MAVLPMVTGDFAEVRRRAAEAKAAEFRKRFEGGRRMSKNLALTPALRASLTNAGIGPIFHEKGFEDFGALGEGYRKWINRHGPQLATDGGAVAERSWSRCANGCWRKYAHIRNWAPPRCSRTRTPSCGYGSTA